MKYFVVVFSLILTISTVTNSQTKGEKNYLIHENLTKVWETMPELITCESVCYNPEKDILYVACINGNPAEKTAMDLLHRSVPAVKLLIRNGLKV